MSEERTIGWVCNYAASQIANGWEIEISIKAGQTTVKLFDRLGEKRMESQGYLEAIVEGAVAYSREHEQ